MKVQSYNRGKQTQTNICLKSYLETDFHNKKWNDKSQ